MTNCVFCGADNWTRLPDPHPARSITTSGVFVEQSLGKSHCNSCGLVQRTAHPFLGLGDFYQNSYSRYYERPGTEQFNRDRYRQIALWVSAAARLAGWPTSVLEVGCGRGWTLRELREILPDVQLSGIEPSMENSEIARHSGFDVLTGTLDQAPVGDRRFDLIFSNHVLQHTIDPLRFLADHKRLLSEGGRVVVSLQDARKPSSELLFSDQNFSLTPAHLAELGDRAGLELIEMYEAPVDQPGLYLSVMAVYREKQTNRSPVVLRLPSAEERAALLAARIAYLQDWAQLDAALLQRARSASRLVNFGAGMFSFQLACYCPEYWAVVEACIVEGQSGEFIGKSVYPAIEDFDPAVTCIGLGTRPWIQGLLAKRLQAEGYKSVRWDDLIEN